jgi:hypothetical protein
MKTIDIETLDENLTPEQIDPNLKGPFEKVLLRKSKPPKVAKVTRVVQKGPRKWKTIYRVRKIDGSIVFSADKFMDSLKMAKKMAIEKVTEYQVTIDKSLVNSDPKVAMVVPGKHREGRYRFIILEGK